ncbi:phospholipid ABC transporter ATP-binding protein MlaF [Pseudaeromonas paramecii]|uniref:phospholipid ABC transporter ATP-binding protein MlaF n=1 Tax=Pseudaeromonas paramecii TaxID=2138166 RepID=UPI003CD09D93
MGECRLTDSLVQINNLSFSHGDRLLYDNISLSIPKGKVTALMGPSGIGKTTLLRLIGGQLKPDSGQVLFDGHDVPRLSRRALYELRKRMSMLFQSGALFTGMTVFENVAYPLREHTQLPEELIRTLVLMKLESVGLRGAAELMPSELSGGMARRAALARAIALDPELILYDEPFVGQDPITMAVLVKLIRQLNQTMGITSVIVSHDVPEVMSIADYVYLIANKRVVAAGTPEELRREGNPEVVQFVQGLPDGPVPFHYPAGNYLEAL